MNPYNDGSSKPQSSRAVRQLNKTVPHPRARTKNAMKRKSSKAFKPKVRAQRGPTNKSSKAVSASTSGRTPVGRMASHGGSLNTARVVQVKPAQRSGSRAPNRRVVNQPSMAMVKRSLKKSMGY